KNGKINNTVSNILYKGKDIILNNVEKNIQQTFNKQLDNFNNVENHISIWEESFNNKDFDGMEKEYSKLKKITENLATIEKKIINNEKKNIQKKFKKKLNNFNNVEKHISIWEESFNNKDFDGMEKEYSKLKEISEDLAPIEKIISKLKEIDTLHNLIKNNGKN